MTAPSHVLGLGMGVDSVAILLRWIHEPETRPCPLEELLVITAQTGDEKPVTGRLMDEHVLPLMRAHGIRYVQVARGQRHVTKAGDGVVVLDDSRWPERTVIEGAYKLSQEMLSAGTIPQTAGARLCSVHSKGDALDPVIHDLTEGQPFTHYIGFELNEPKRVAKDEGYNTDVRTGAYPLVEWAWTRAMCEGYIFAHTGVMWPKSACSFCPFAMQNKASLVETLARYAEEPEVAADALFMEHVALALNPAQGLIGGKRLVDLLRAEGHTEALRLFSQRVDQAPSAVYEVRRILRPKKDDPTKQANAARSVRKVATGSRGDAFVDMSMLDGRAVRGEDGIERLWVETRGEGFPTRERFYVVAPAVADDKESPKFDAWWTAAA